MFRFKSSGGLRPTIILIMGMLILPGALIMVDKAADRADASEQPPTMPEHGICAHRGASRTHPENTAAAFKQAIRLDVAMIEFDVYQTKDDQIVVIHDATVDRTTDGKGKVAQMTLEQIRALDAGRWKDEKFAGQKVPTLAEALAMMPKDIWLNVHMKDGETLGTLVAEQILESGREHQAVMMCEKLSHAQQARQVSDDMLVGGWLNPDGSYGPHPKIQDPFMIQFYGGLPQRDVVAELRSRDVLVNYCCTNDPKQAGPIFEMGVQFILVDDVEVMVNADVDKCSCR